MKKILHICLALFLVLSMTACTSNEIENGSNTSPNENSNGQSDVQEGNENEEKENTATIYTIFSLGGTDGSEVNMQGHTITYTGELTPKLLADELTALTGYNFAIEVMSQDEGSTGDILWIEWLSDSTLITATDGLFEPKEGYFMQEIELIRWFMLDSLYETIIENMDVDEIYYSTEGNVDSEFGNSIVTSAFGANQMNAPYMGSNFYKNHAGNVGDELDAHFTMMEGTWYLNGEYDNDFIDMFSDGSFVYYSDGKAYAQGVMTYEVIEEEYIVYYHLYTEDTADLTIFDRSFYIISENIIQFDTLGEFIRTEG